MVGPSIISESEQVSNAEWSSTRGENLREFLEEMGETERAQHDEWYDAFADMVRSGDYSRDSIKVLAECGALQIQKGHDYQNVASTVRQAQHYRRGVATIFDMIWQKILRARSIIEAAESRQDATVANESLEDTFRDIINYCSFAVSFMRGTMDGQEPGRDIFNRVTRGIE